MKKEFVSRMQAPMDSKDFKLTRHRRKEPWEKDMDQYIYFHIISILKAYSDREHPVTTGFIKKQLEARFGFGVEEFDDSINKRLKRKLNSLCDMGLGYAAAEKNCATMDADLKTNWKNRAPMDVYNSIGGRVVRSEKRIRNKDAYYFEKI